MERYRGEDAGDLKRSEVNKWVEVRTCLHVLERKIWKINQKIQMDEKTWKRSQKIVMDEELVQHIVRDEELVQNIVREEELVQNVVMDEEVVQNIVMDEELIQNGMMDEKFVKNFVMDEEIDEMVVIDLSMFKIGGWNITQPSDRKLLEEFIDENERWLLIRIPSRDSFFMIQYLERHSVSSDQHVKELMPLREGLHMGMQCHMRQHFADHYWLHEHPGRHTSRRESTRIRSWPLQGYHGIFVVSPSVPEHTVPRRTSQKQVPLAVARKPFLHSLVSSASPLTFLSNCTQTSRDSPGIPSGGILTKSGCFCLIGSQC